MRYVRLQCFEDRQGLDGLKLKEVRLWDASDAALEGMLIAHDIIEHQNGPRAIGGMADEFEALGAMWYVRGENYQWSFNTGSNEEPIWRELVNLCNYYDRDWPGWIHGETKPKQPVFADMLDEVETNEEFLKMSDSDRYRFRQESIHHMNVGYQKAKRRFRNAQDAFDNFTAIELAVDNLIQYEEMIPGFEWTLGYGRGHAQWFPQTFYY